MKFRSQPAKGTQDILPKDMALRNYVLDIIRKTYSQKGFTQIQTPSVENIDLLTNSDGGENLRMLFKILKRGEKLTMTDATEASLTDLGLRFDLTLPLSRFYANNRNDLPMPFKAIQMGDVWRAERPQKGRYRQFTQCDVDIIGEPSIIAEIDLLTTVPEAIMRLGFTNFTIKINDRRLLKEMVLAAGIDEAIFPSVCITLDKADKIGVAGVTAELKEKQLTDTQISTLLTRLETSLEDLDTPAAKEMKTIIDTVAPMYPIEFDPTLVRGMGYYTGAIFEIASNEFKGSLAGGGRYDTLMTKFQKEPVPAVGFSIGFERICDLLKQNNFTIEAKEKVALIVLDDAYLAKAAKLSNDMAKEDTTVSLFKVKPKKMGKRMTQLEEEGYTQIIVVDRM